MDKRTPEEMDNAKPWDLLINPDFTSQEIRNERLNICKGCDHLFKPTRTCKKCGCFMAAKTWLRKAYCPIGLWDSDKEERNTNVV
jgi:hypothetical protein